MRSQSLDNLGLVAGMIDELGIVKVIDSHIKQDMSQRNVSIGECTKAMIINGLGFVNHQMYLVSEFFKDKPINRLFGRKIDYRYFNDDVLGRAMDSIYSYDLCQLFTKISSKTFNVLNLKDSTYHLDSTSFHTHGDHLNLNPLDENVIELTKGYSRDHHPELNQVILEMIVSNIGGIPLAMKPLSGNKADKAEFPKIIENFAKNLEYSELEPITFIADSALYSADNIKELPENVKFITRVPETINELKKHYASLSLNEFIEIDENYSYQEVTSEYAGLKQRWIIILSQAAHKKKLKTFEKNLAKKSESELKKYNKLSKKLFACKADALKAADDFFQKCKNINYSELNLIEVKVFKGKGRPSKNAKPKIQYQIQAYLKTDLNSIENQKSRLGFFTLATNHMDNYTASEILKLYKDQGKVERGFRFLKDHTFMASSIYLEKPQRIEALMFIMSLCLMVYSALEYRIRKGLKDNDLTYENQSKKEIKNPTAKWIFQNFVGIHVIYFDDKIRVLNKERRHRKILRLLGEEYKDIYS